MHSRMKGYGTMIDDEMEPHIAVNLELNATFDMLWPKFSFFHGPHEGI